MPHRSRWKLVAVAVAGVLAARVAGCGGCADAPPPRQPDERLALHFTHLCELAREGTDEPRQGIVRWLRYHGDHGPDMASAFTETLVAIERIADDAAHDARARKARERLRAPLVACEDDLAAFFAAVADDRDASATVERATARLNRTLEILLGTDGANLDPRALLRRLDRLAPAPTAGRR